MKEHWELKVAITNLMELRLNIVVPSLITNEKLPKDVFKKSHAWAPIPVFLFNWPQEEPENLYIFKSLQQS